MSNKRRHLSLIVFACSAMLLLSDLSAQSTPPIVFSASNSADYSPAIAQGSLFAVFGASLGPATLVKISAFPLPNTLSGTSVTVTSGSTTLNCPMIYTSAGQVAAILPSNTPIGPASVTVAYNGATSPYGYSTTQVTVAESSVGIFTITENGLGGGIFTALDYTLKTFGNTAKPGEIVTAWATGIGPINSPDNVLPTSFPNFPNVQVWVAGQAANIVYAGRSGCCAAVDQIAFTVPVVADGCNVPVAVVTGGGSSNTVGLPVNGSGGACSDSGPTLPTSFLTKAATGLPVKVAVIAIGPKAIGNSAEVAQTLAARLSAALHTRVSKADAARLLRAYAAKNPRAIRMAMAKYARQWKALDARTKARITAQIGQTQEGAAAIFGSISNEAVTATVASAQLPPAGACVALPNSVPSGLGSTGASLDAGASLSLTGAAGPLILKQNSYRKGEYHAMFASSIIGPNVPLGSYTISGSGGTDVGAFSATITVGSHLAISNKSSLATIDRTQPLTVTWTGGTEGNYVLIGGYTPNAYSSGAYFPNAYFACAEDAGKGTLTIPAYILSTMNATANTKGILGISSHPLSNQIAIPGVDLAYFIDGSSDSANVTFK